jgi:hypothetical protein
VPPTLWSGGGGRADSLAGQGLGGVPIPTGVIHCGALYVQVLCDSKSSSGQNTGIGIFLNINFK